MTGRVSLGSLMYLASLDSSVSRVSAVHCGIVHTALYWGVLNEFCSETSTNPDFVTIRIILSKTSA